MGYALVMLLGALQGITEFLPVSSSGHLVLLERLAGVHPSLAMNVGLHLGTLAAVLVYYWRDLWELLKAVPDALRFRDTEDTRTIAHLAVATVITAPIGIALEAPLDSFFAGPLGYWALGATFAITTGLLLLSRGRQGSNDLDWKRAAIIGLAQGFAVLPGISRSGTTIVVAMLMGISPDRATRFSFLLSIPVIAGAGLLEARHLSGIEPGPLLVGMGVAAVVGYVALRWLISLISKGNLWKFSWYVGPLALLSLGLALR